MQNRRHKRRSFEAVARITAQDGSRPMVCAISDISQGGACLRVERPDLVPDEFLLWLSGNGAVRRRCRAAWRSYDRVGACFI